MLLVSPIRRFSPPFSAPWECIITLFNGVSFLNIDDTPTEGPKFFYIPDKRDRCGSDRTKTTSTSPPTGEKGQVQTEFGAYFERNSLSIYLASHSFLPALERSHYVMNPTNIVEVPLSVHLIVSENLII